MTRHADLVLAMIVAMVATVATYAFIGQVNRIFGDSLPMSSHLAEVTHTLASIGTLRAYLTTSRTTCCLATVTVFHSKDAR